MYIAAKQISQELMTSTEIEASDGLKYKDEKSNEITISLDNERIVKKPGFEIFAFHVDELSFKIENDFIYMIIERNDKQFTFLVGDDIETF